MDNNIIKGEPEYMRKIREEVECELAEEQETAVHEVDKYNLYCMQVDGESTWDNMLIAKNLVLMHNYLLDWIGMMDEDIFVLLYLSTIARGCLVRVNEETGEYDSALILLATEDEVTVVVDTADQSIMSGTNDQLYMRIELPYADLIQRKIHRYYDIACRTREMETITAPTGEKAKVLFANYL